MQQFALGARTPHAWGGSYAEPLPGCWCLCFACRDVEESRCSGTKCSYIMELSILPEFELARLPGRPKSPRRVLGDLRDPFLCSVAPQPCPSITPSVPCPFHSPAASHAPKVLPQHALPHLHLSHAPSTALLQPRSYTTLQCTLIGPSQTISLTACLKSRPSYILPLHHPVTPLP